MRGQLDNSEWDATPLGGEDDVGAVRIQRVRAADGRLSAAVVPTAFGRLGGEAVEVVRDLQRVGAAMAALQVEARELVAEARELGVSWDLLGWSLGVTGEGARKRYGGDGVDR